MSTIAERLKSIRTDCGLNQIEFSKIIGVTNAHISRMEKGITIPSDSLTKLICKEFGVNEEWLKTGIEPMYIEDFATYTDEMMSSSINLFNKLLNNKNEKVRYRAAKLNGLFAEITNVNDLEDTDKVIFLDLLIDLFSTIQTHNVPIKKRISNKQLVFDEILNIFFEQYKKNIGQNIDNFKQKLEETIY